MRAPFVLLLLLVVLCAPAGAKQLRWKQCEWPGLEAAVQHFSKVRGAAADGGKLLRPSRTALLLPGMQH